MLICSGKCLAMKGLSLSLMIELLISNFSFLCEVLRGGKRLLVDFFCTGNEAILFLFFCEKVF